jgi:acyl carrier protein
MRVELGEIETALSQHQAVQQTVVLGREDETGEKFLVAYVVPDPGKAPTSIELRRFVAAKLPDYMLPSALVFLDKVPLTPNGKIDRLALPAPDAIQREVQDLSVESSNTVERQLIDIWQEVLGTKLIGVNDNFFEIGGHSLLAVQLLARIERAFGQHISVANLYQAPTVAQLLQMLQGDRSLTLPPAVLQIQPSPPSGKRPILFCIHVLGSGLSYYRPLARYLGTEQPM